MTDEDLFEKWLAQLAHRRDVTKRFSPQESGASLLGKRYFHLDYPVTDQELERWKPTLLDPEQVRKRAFYPFLKTVKVRKRFAKDDDGVRRIHPEGPKKREICYAAHHDALFLSWYGFRLEALLEPRIHALGLDACVLAYRSTGQNNIHFAKAVFDYVGAQPECVALAFDVTKFFDRLNHAKLKHAWVTSQRPLHCL